MTGAHGATGADRHLDAHLAADRWELWCTLSRGMAHQLANASQMLALDPAPPLALEEARERVARAMAALAAMRMDDTPGPSLLASALADMELLQRLQMEFPAIALGTRCAPGLPPLAMSAGDLLHALLAQLTLARRGAAERRPELFLDARLDGTHVAITLTGTHAADDATARHALELLLARAGGEARFGSAPASIELRLPVWPTGSAASPASSDRRP